MTTIKPEKIKRHRLALGLTQKQVAKQLGVSAAYFSLLESGQRTPSPDLQGVLSEMLAIEPPLPKRCACGVIIDGAMQQCWACRVEERARRWREKALRETD